jgi:hypothetical protein
VSSPIIDQLKPGLVRVRGKIKMTRLPSASAEPVLEIDADSIFATESA